VPKAKPISLHPLTFHEALKAIVSVDPAKVGLGPKRENRNNDHESQSSGNLRDPETRRTAPITRAIVDIPDSVLNQLRGYQREQERDSHISRTIGVWAVGAALSLAAISYWQGCSTQKAANAAKESADAEVAANRAWIVPNGSKNMDGREDVFGL
jgi:hypothetical protein